MIDLTDMTDPLAQKAQARKYDVNLVWHFAEIEPYIWCLYTPDRRAPVVIGTLEEVVSAYRERSPVVFTRVSIPQKQNRFANVQIKI